MANFAYETISGPEALGFSAANDTLSFQGLGAQASLVTTQYGANTVTVLLNGQSVTFGLGLMGETATFPDGGVLYVGGSSADVQSTTAFADGLFGGLGDDILGGGSGADRMQGNQGADTLSGAAGADTLSGGKDNDHLDGGDDADRLYGNLGDDLILGGAGDDLIEGGQGADTLDGGPGADVFLFGAGASGTTFATADRILNFAGEDRFDVPGVGGEGNFYRIPAAVSGGPSDPNDPYYGGEVGGGGGAIATMSFAQALATANSWIAGHADDPIVTAQVTESGVGVFIDTNGDRVVDISMFLAGADLYSVLGAHFI